MPRQILGKNLLPMAAPFLIPSGPSDIRNLVPHVLGRTEMTVELFTDVAYLRSKGVLSHSDVVACSGARYQDARGSSQYDCAHRLPGNVKIGLFTVPEWAGLLSPELGRFVKYSFAKTDPLPSWINQFPEKLFEEGGARWALGEGVREVILEQGKGRSVNIFLVESVVKRVTSLGYDQAYEVARQQVRKMTDSEYSKRMGGIIISPSDWERALSELPPMGKGNLGPTSKSPRSADDILVVSQNTGKNYHVSHTNQIKQRVEVHESQPKKTEAKTTEEA